MRSGRFVFPRRSRLTRKADIDRVRQEGRRFRSEHLDVRTTSSPFSYPRVGIVVARFNRTIVERNRLRRRLRELTRLYLIPFIPAQDVLVRASPTAYGRTFAALETEVRRLATQLRAGSSE